jgi:hypothetical protein
MYFMHRINKNVKYIKLLSCLWNIKCDFYFMLINDLTKSSISNHAANEEKRTTKQKEKWRQEPVNGVHQSLATSLSPLPS